MFKIIAASLLTASFLFKLFLKIRSYLARNRGIPEELNDVYDQETYLKWKKYSSEHIIVDIISSSISYGVTLAIILTNLFAYVTNGISNIYASAIVVLALYIGIFEVFDIIFGYIKTMKIEQKYGFNKSTMKTFVVDIIKGLIIESILLIGLVSLFIVIYENLHDYTLVLFTGIVFFIVLLISFLYPFLSKLFNKFAPLPEGELKTRLIALLEKHGYHVKEIKVMDASRRTTKSNAYFAGFSKMKTIVLFDNILKAMNDDEIVAVFAHEMGHGLHKDTLKNSLFSLLNIIVIVILTWLLVRYPSIYNDFGFNGLNYGFAFILVSDVVLPLVSILLGFISSSQSRRAEYRADKQAFDEGYAEALISGLKKLARENFSDLNPDPLVVVLSYSHPTLLQRIRRIRSLENK